MKPTTDLEQVKSVARALLMTEVYKTPYSPMVVQHPFTSSGFVATTKDGVMQLIDITESEENLQAWQSFMRKQINSTDNAYEIYMMTNNLTCGMIMARRRGLAMSRQPSNSKRLAQRSRIISVCMLILNLPKETA